MITRPRWIVLERRRTFGRIITTGLLIAASLTWCISGSVWRDGV
jgi:hypothetical protein